MLLSNVESSEEGNTHFESTFVVLEDGLVGEVEVLANDFGGCFLFGLHY